MQKRYIALAAVIGVVALLLAIHRVPAGPVQLAGRDGIAATAQRATAQYARRSHDEAANPLGHDPVLNGQYTPSDLQRELNYLLTLRDDGASPAELLRLAESVYQDLLTAGTVALAEVLDFLESGEDVPLNGQAGATFDFQSLRLALIDALWQIGGIEVERAFLEELHLTDSNAELEALATALESLQPGLYGTVVLDRALNLLREQKSGMASGVLEDTAPLFRVLQNFGHQDIATMLQGVPYWLNGYAEVALANIPGGQGLDALAHVARRELRRSEDSRALHLLAQSAAGENRAEQALFDLQRQLLCGVIAAGSRPAAGANQPLAGCAIESGGASRTLGGVRPVGHVLLTACALSCRACRCEAETQ